MISVRFIVRFICVVFRKITFQDCGFAAAQCGKAKPLRSVSTFRCDQRPSFESLRVKGARHLFQSVDESWARTRKKIAVDFVDAAI